MLDRREKLHEREALLTNAAFERYAAGFELYQHMFAKQTDENERGKIHDRMMALHMNEQKKQLVEIDGDEKKVAESYVALAEEVLGQCEQGLFTKQKFADALISSEFGQKLIEQLTPKHAGYVEPGSGMIYVNESMRYHFDGEDKIQISLHIEPMNASVQDAIGKIKEGLQVIASQLQSGEIPAKQIMMTSWLINPKTAERFFGTGVSVEMIQSWEDSKPALIYNQKKLEKYLQNGEVPAVGKMTLSKEEFIRRISS